MLVTYQRGRGFPVYRGGLPYMGMQRGRGFGSVLGSLFRNFVVPAAKSVGKSLVRTGLKKASNVMRGVAQGQSIKKAVSKELMPRAAPKRKAPQARRQKRRRVATTKAVRQDIFNR